MEEDKKQKGKVENSCEKQKTVCRGSAHTLYSIGDGRDSDQSDAGFLYTYSPFLNSK
jgi:hypothetical protein